MKRLFDFVETISEMKGITGCDNNGYELAKILKSSDKTLIKLCDLIYEAKSNYEHIKEIF